MSLQFFTLTVFLSAASQPYHTSTAAAEATRRFSMRTAYVLGELSGLDTLLQTAVDVNIALVWRLDLQGAVRPFVSTLSSEPTDR